MNESQAKVLSYLAGSTDINALSVETLKRLVEEDPYFPVVQFLLAKKLQADNDSNFMPQVQKTALFFSNPFWLQDQLQDIRFDLAAEENPSAYTVSPGLTEEQNHPVTDSFSNVELAAASNLAHETLGDTIAAEDEKSFEEPASPNPSVTETETNKTKEVIAGVTEEDAITSVDQFDQNVLSIMQPDFKEPSVDVPTETNAETGSSIEPDQTLPFSIRSSNDAIDSAVNQAEEESAATTRDTDNHAEQFLDNPDQELHPFNKDEAMADASTPAAAAESDEISEELAGARQDTSKATEAFLEEAEPVIAEQLHEIREMHPASSTEFNEDDLPPEEDLKDQDEHERMFENIKAMLDASSEEANAEVKNAYVPIDPYYTIDYFASQGIKLELDQNPQDPLGKNLKKFTQWLKHMKKLGPEDAMETIKQQETDEDIQQIADSSNVVKEVVTEAMASVLEKQGKKDKAIELYNKLSFLNPHKSAYFADKIKILKGI